MGIEFTVDLKGNVAEQAQSQSTALKGSANAAKILGTEMSSLEAKLVKASALGDVKAFKKLSTDLGMVKTALGQLPPALGSSTAAMGEASAGAGGLGASVGELGAAGGPYGAAAAAALKFGTIAVAAFAAVIAAGAALAISASLAKDKMLAMFSAMSGGEKQGAAVVAMLGQLDDQLGVTKADLAGAAKAFEAMGITDLSALKTQIVAVSSVAAVMGDTGAEAYKKLISKTQEAIDAGGKFKVSDKQIAGFRAMGITVSELAARMGTTSRALEQGLTKGTLDARKFQDALGDVARNKFGDVLKEQALEPANLWARFKETIAGLFADVKVKPFLESIQRLIGIFSSDKASGKAMKAGLTSTFDAIFTKASKFVTWLSHALLQVEIATLKAMIWLKPWVKGFDDLDAKYGIVDKFITGLKVLGVAILAIGAMLVLPILAFAALGVAATAAVAWLVGAVVAAIGWVVKLVESFDPAKAYAAATDFVSGLVDGIKAGALRVVDAAKDMASSALDAVTGVFKSHSPSLVMRQIGDIGVAGGLALGIAAGTPDVTGASRVMAEASVGEVGQQVGAANAPGRTAAEPAPWDRPSTSSSNSATENHFHFAPGALAVHGGGKSAESITEEMVATVFERISLEQGT